MADTAVAITAGTGTNIDTRTEGTNGNHRQVIVIGDPATNDSVAAVKAASTAAVATDPAVVVAISPNGQNVNGRAAAADSTPTVMSTEDKTALDAAVTALQIIDNIVSGSEAQVDVVAALPAGSNVIGGVTNPALTNFGAGEYETVAASQTAQTLGATGATGDYISGILVIPATTSPGNVLLLDNATSITVFAGGATSVSNLVPFFIPLGMISVSGAWKITTGANVSCIGIGNFT